MYTQLLRAALDQHPRADGTSTTGEALAEVLRSRSQLGSSVSSSTESGWAAAAVSDQLAYDVALIALAGQLGITCEVRSFDPPLSERTRLERELAARGIRLEGLEKRVAPEQE